MNAYLLLMLITLLAADGFEMLGSGPSSDAFSSLNGSSRSLPSGWRGVLLAAPLVIEIGYDLIIQAVYVKSLIDIATGSKSGWNTVVREVAPQ